jgi:hypothetical protein
MKSEQFRLILQELQFYNSKIRSPINDRYGQGEGLEPPPVKASVTRPGPGRNTVTVAADLYPGCRITPVAVVSTAS